MELLDTDGYPTQDALLAVAAHDTINDVDGFLDLIESLWSYPDRFCLKGNDLYLSTGGWSGNEAVIKAMRKNFFFFLAHTKWKRGGHYWFNITAFKRRNNPTTDEG